MHLRTSTFVRAGALGALALAALALMASGAAATESPSPEILTAYSSEVVVSPADAAAGAYSFQVVIRDRRSGEVVAAPTLLAQAGESGEVRSGLPAESGAQSLKVEVGVSEDQKAASYEIGMRQGDTEVSLHKGRIVLR